MDRRVKLVLAWATLAALVLGICAVAWRLHLVETGAVGNPRWPACAILLAVPLIMGALLVVFDRHVKNLKAGLSQENPRHIQATLLFGYPFIAVCQGLMAFALAGKDAIGGDNLVRLAAMICGAWLIERGNAFAKLPAPAVAAGTSKPWTRVALYAGWTSVIAGLVVISSAVFLDVNALLWVAVATSVLLIGWGVALGRELAGIRRRRA